jgi:hypothetical protein
VEQNLIHYSLSHNQDTRLTSIQYTKQCTIKFVVKHLLIIISSSVSAENWILLVQYLAEFIWFYVPIFFHRIIFYPTIAIRICNRIRKFCCRYDKILPDPQHWIKRRLPYIWSYLRLSTSCLWHHLLKDISLDSKIFIISFKMKTKFYILTFGNYFIIWGSQGGHLANINVSENS